MMWTGQLFLIQMFIIITIKPLVVTTKRFKWLLKTRRYQGWLIGLVATLHVGYYLFFYLDSVTQLVSSIQSWWLITGLITAVTAWLLTATSNDYSVKKLGKDWSKLHKLTYAIPFIGLLHWYLAVKGFPTTEIAWWSIGFLILILWRHRDLRTLALASMVWFAVAFGGTELVSYYSAPTTNLSHSSQLHDDIDTSHPDYERIWWETSESRSDFWGVLDVQYSEDAIAFCAQHNSYPVSIGERPLYCADGTRR